jgi:D-Tyr-tRNAtyr deacylase
MSAPTVEQKVERFCKARDNMKDLLEQSKETPSRFAQRCETLFSEFRLCCVHLRNEIKALDQVKDKESAWRFICRFCRECPVQHNRCVEVLRILLLSDEWMKAFKADPDVDFDALPKQIQEEFGKRLDEVERDGGGPREPRPSNGRGSDPKGGYPSDSEGLGIGDGVMPLVVNSMSIVIQRCTKASLQADERSQPKQIGPGIIVSVTMAMGATEEGIINAARFILNGPFSGKIGWTPSGGGLEKYANGAESIASLCMAGESQGILVLPQPSLISDLTDGMNLRYTRSTTNSRKMAQMYELFITKLRENAAAVGQKPGSKKPDVVAAKFGESPLIESSSAGPFTHSFAF